MKKLILIFMFALLLLPLASAFEFDNVKDYNLSNREVTIINAFNLPLIGSTISTIKLESELNEIVFEGKDQKIAEFTITSSSNYQNALRKLELFDINKGMRKFSRDYTYKRKVPGTKEIENDKICTGLITNEICSYVDGKPTKVIDSPTWVDLGKDVDFLEGQVITIGIFMDVTAGEVIEWIPTFWGVDIEEWATFTVVAAHGLDDDTTSGGGDLEQGITVKINEEGVSVIRLTAFTEGVFDTGMILNFDNTTIDVCVFVGINCTFSTPVALTQGVSYRVAGNDSGGVYSSRRVNGPVAYPISTTYIDFLEGFKSDGDGQTSIWNIEFITLEITLIEGQVDLIEPLNGAIINVADILLNASGNFTSDDGHGVTNMTLFVDGLLNTTIFNSTAQQNLTLGTRLNFSEGFHSWSTNISIANGLQFNSSNFSFTVDTIPPTTTISFPNESITYHRNATNLTLIWTASDDLLDSCWYDYEGINITVGCGSNLAQFNVTSFENKNITFYANDSGNLLTAKLVNWSYKAFENSRTFNTTTSETSSETFIINITSDGTQSITSTFDYAGTNRGTSTKVGNNENMTFSSTFSVPVGTSHNFFWNITHGTTNFVSNTSTQTISPIILDICNSTLSTPYINFAFKNETLAQESTNATISSAWTYWLNDQNVNKTLIHINATENPSYAFCFSPSDTPINVKYQLDYNNAISQQRTFVATSLISNVTTDVTLFLLPTTAGLFTQFSVQDIVANAISGAKAVITRLVSGSPVTVFSGFSDDSGVLVSFLNPDVTYSATFSKSGLSDVVFSFVPITDARIVIMGSGQSDVSGSNISEDLVYTITPANSTLQNNTIVMFGFNVSGNDDVGLIKMNITNQEDIELDSTSNAGVGFISLNVNTNNNTLIIGKFSIQNADETLVFTKSWVVGNTFVGEYSLFRQMGFFVGYGFQDFIRVLIVIGIILGMMIYMSGGKATDTLSEGSILVAITLVWMFSVVGWLNAPVQIVSTNLILQLGRQYGIAIISTAAGMFFILRRLVR